MVLFASVLVSRSTGAVVIEVKESGSLHPLAGATIMATKGSNTVSGVTGIDGVCSLDVTLASGGHIDVEKDGWCPMHWELSGADLARQQGRFLFFLPPARTLAGTVVDESKVPIAGARIELNFPQRLSGPHIPLDDLAAVSDASGHWKAAFVPEDINYVHLDVTEPNHQWQDNQPSLRELRAGTAVLTMSTLRVVRGRVVDPDGQPVAGALVYVGNEWGIMGSGNNPGVPTAADGSFEFSPASLGKKQLAAWDSRFAPVSTTIDLTADTPPIELRLATPKVRRFRVTDLDGNPLTNASAKVSDWESFHYPPEEFKVNADGRFVFSNAPAGRIAIDFTAPDHFGLPMRPVSETEDEQIIQLGPALRLHGKVTDQKTGAPLTEFKITPGWPRQTFFNGQMTNQGGQWAPYQTKTFRDGSYDWTFNQHVIVGTEKPYDFLLRVEADGYAPSVSRIIKVTEKDAEVDFALSPPTYHTNWIQFSDGSPANGATIYLADDGNELQFHNGVLQNQFRNPTTLTADQAGRFIWMKDESVSAIVVLHEKGFSQLAPADLESSNTITLTRWGSISGTLWRGRHLESHQPITLCFNQNRVGGKQRPELRPGLFYNYEATTDDQGRFTFDKVVPGDVAVARLEPIPRPPMHGTFLGDVWAGCRLTVVHVTEGGQVEVKAGGTGRVVTGTLVSTNNFANCEVTLTALLPPIPYPDGMGAADKQEWVKRWFWSDAAARYRIWYGAPPEITSFGPWIHFWQVKVAADGAFQIDDLPAGNYTLTAVFSPSGQPRGFFPGFPSPVANETGTISQKFSVPDGGDLPTLPPLYLGAIGGSPEDPEISVAAPSDHQPVTAGIAAEHATVRPGDIFDVVVRIRIAEGHHIYAAGPANPAVFTGTAVNLTMPDALESVSDWSTLPMARMRNGNLVYTNAVVFRRSLKLRADAPAGSLPIKGILRFQACNDQLCWPPKDLPLATTIQVEPPSKGAP
jgi:hypothetical protein